MKEELLREEEEGEEKGGREGMRLEDREDGGRV